MEVFGRLPYPYRRTIIPRQYIPAEGSHTHLISLRIICPPLLEKNLRFPSSLLTMQRLALELSGGASVQRLNNAGIDYAIETDTYRGGMIFVSERVGAFFYVDPQAQSGALEVLERANVKPYRDDAA